MRRTAWRPSTIIRPTRGALRPLLVAIVTLALVGILSTSTRAAPPRPEPDPPCVPGPLAQAGPRCQSPTSPALSSPAATAPVLSSVVCTPGRVWRWHGNCPNYGPATTGYRLTHISLPNPLPELPVVEIEPDPDDDLVPFTYARVQDLPLLIYRHPMEAALGLPPVRILYAGDQWVSIEGEVEYGGERWYQINKDEFARADAFALARPSHFQGVYLSEQPQLPFAWINRTVRPSATPQGPPSPAGRTFYRYELVSIYAQEVRGSNELWYLIGPDQWVEQSYVAKVTVDPPPPGVGPGEKWIEVDLFEQTLAAYEGERMVYATLISSGRPGPTWTESGLFRIWLKLWHGKMSNPDTQDGDPAWYYLEDVPWTMYFNGATALHTSYWHDTFGFTYSHGCVNLPPRDARWLFYWTSPPISADVKYVNGPGTWVWVHNSSPFGQ